MHSYAWFRVMHETFHKCSISACVMHLYARQDLCKLMLKHLCTLMLLMSVICSIRIAVSWWKHDQPSVLCALSKNVNEICCIMNFFGVLRRYVENGAGASKWVGRDDRNYKSIPCGLMGHVRECPRRRRSLRDRYTRVQLRVCRKPLDFEPP